MSLSVAAVLFKLQSWRKKGEKCRDTVGSESSLTRGLCQQISIANQAEAHFLPFIPSFSSLMIF